MFIFVQPLIMSYKDDRHVLSVVIDGEASWVCPRHDFNYLLLLYANLGQDESLGFLMVPIYTFYAGRSRENVNQGLQKPGF